MRMISQRRSLAIVAAAALAIPAGASSLFANAPSARGVANIPHYLAAADDKDKNKDDKKENPLKTHAGELELIADLLDQELNPDGGLKAILGSIREHDRKRVNDELSQSRPKFDELVKQFREEWHKHYDDNFNAQNHKGILSADRIEQVDKGDTHYARVYFEATAGRPSYQIHLSKDADGKYRVDLPESTTGQMLYGRLEANLKQAFDSKDDWPKEQSVAYARAAHLLLFAFRYEEAGDKDNNDQKKK